MYSYICVKKQLITNKRLNIMDIRNELCIGGTRSKDTFAMFIEDGNATRLSNGNYVAQVTQHNKEYTLQELYELFLKESV